MAMGVQLGGDLPSLVDGSVSNRARETTEALLEAYYYQDERESFLLRGDLERAEEMSSKAQERMADTYERELPQVRTEDARAAGRSFMQALFLQDEIENWGLLEQAPNRDELDDLLLSDTPDAGFSDPASDPRWDDVRAHLADACELANIDPEYAEKQARFWLLHGQLREYWEEVAIDAHTIKLDAMVPNPSDDVARNLGRYFVTGVKIHDKWGHRRKDADLEDMLDIVGEYYQKIFDLRESEQCKE